MNSNIFYCRMLYKLVFCWRFSSDDDFCQSKRRFISVAALTAKLASENIFLSLGETCQKQREKSCFGLKACESFLDNLDFKKKMSELLKEMSTHSSYFWTQNGN